MTRRQRRDREHCDRLYPVPHRIKTNRSRRARGKMRVRILGDKLNRRGRGAYAIDLAHLLRVTE